MSIRKVTWDTEKRGKGYAWLVDYVDQDGTRCAKNFKTQEEAKQYHAQVVVDVSQGTHIAPSKSPSIAQTVDKWLKRVETRKREPSTLRQYQQHRKHIVDRLGAVKLAQLTPTAVENFRDRLQEELSSALAKKVLTSFKSALKVSKRSHVAQDVSIETSDEKEPLEIGKDIPSPAEIKRIVDSVDTSEPKRAARMRALLLTLAFVGLRASEIRGLRWSDVDRKDTKEITIRRKADRKNIIGKTKSAKSRRAIAIEQDYLLPALREWHMATEHKDGYVFPTSTGAVEHHKNMLRSVELILKRAKVVDKEGEPKYSLHAFRHFFASWCLNPVDRGGLGMQLFEVSRLMGHSSIKITADIYGHLLPGGDHHSKFAAGARAIFVG